MPGKASTPLSETLAARGVDVQAVKAALKAQRIEAPSWGLRELRHPLQGLPLARGGPHHS